jgi:hypothetical protein
VLKRIYHVISIEKVGEKIAVDDLSVDSKVEILSARFGRVGAEFRKEGAKCSVALCPKKTGTYS